MSPVRHVPGVSCPFRLWGLPHKWKTYHWDKFGTGVRDQPVQRCSVCGRWKGES